jgi:hypothetical protein
MRQIEPKSSRFEWKDDGQVILTLKKEDGPSYWKNLALDSDKSHRMNPWREIANRYSE